MARLIPNHFGVNPQAIQSFDWTDLASGTGYVLYYGSCVNLTGGADYIMTEVTPVADPTYTEGSTSEPDYTMVLNLDFDVTFNLPRIIEGQAVINIPVAEKSDNPCYVICQLNKYDGSTETAIGSAVQSVNYDAEDTGSFQSHTFALNYTVPKTLIKSGEILRLTVEGWLKENVAEGTAYMRIKHDPSTAANQIKFYCPFDIIS